VHRGDDGFRWSDQSSALRLHVFRQVHNEMISFASKSTHGRGGMMAKVEAAWMAAEQGCSVVILNGKNPDSILQVS
jgi:glutamate 5-kinase